MNDELIKKLQEADIFTPVSKEESDDREANRPPRVMTKDDINAYVSVVVCSDIMDVLRGHAQPVDNKTVRDLFECVMEGMSITDKPVAMWNPRDLIGYMKKRYDDVSTPKPTFKKFLIELVQDQTEEYFTDIEGVV